MENLDSLRAKAEKLLAQEWFVDGHYHRRKGCICLSCHTLTGFQLESRFALDCEDVTSNMPEYTDDLEWPPEEQCNQTVLTSDQAQFFARSPGVILDLINRIHELTSEP